MAKDKEALGQMLQVRINDELMQGLDDLRRLEADVPTRPEMARRLIERAVAVLRKKEKR